MNQFTLTAEEVELLMEALDVFEHEVDKAVPAINFGEALLHQLPEELKPDWERAKDELLTKARRSKERTILLKARLIQHKDKINIEALTNGKV